MGCIGYGQPSRRQTRFRSARETPYGSHRPTGEQWSEPVGGGASLACMSSDGSRWVDEFREGGQKALQKAGRAGRKPELTEADLERLGDLLLQGPEQLGYETPLWTCARVAHLIEDEFGVRYHRGHVWKILDDLGWSCQRPVGRTRERNEEQI